MRKVLAEYFSQLSRLAEEPHELSEKLPYNRLMLVAIFVLLFDLTVYALSILGIITEVKVISLHIATGVLIVPLFFKFFRDKYYAIECQIYLQVLWLIAFPVGVLYTAMQYQLAGPFLAMSVFMLYAIYEITDWRLSTYYVAFGIFVNFVLYISGFHPDLSLSGFNAVGSITTFLLAWIFIFISETSKINLRMEKINVRAETMGVIAHELRTPLSAAQMSRDYIEENLPKNLLSQKIVNHLNLLDRTLIYANQLITFHGSAVELLDHKATVPQHVDLKGVLTSAIKSYPDSLNDEKDYITTDLESPCNVLINVEQMAQVIHNLLSNAFRAIEVRKKEMRLGDIHITLKVHQDDGRHRSALIEITDKGVGIAEESISSIFSKNYKAGYSRYDTRPTHGLGLIMSKRFMESMGGTISCTSKPGHGTTFTLRVPIREKVVEQNHFMSGASSSKA